MNIKSTNIKNFTVFDDFQLNSDSGINIIIGNNGTGKTHLLKSLYAVCESINIINKNMHPYDIAQPYFKVNSIDLVKDKSDINKETSITVSYVKDDYEKCVTIKHEGHRLTADGVSCEYIDFNISDIFVPAKEILSHSRGFLALNNKYDMPFDKTYVDIITNAELPN